MSTVADTAGADPWWTWAEKSGRPMVAELPVPWWTSMSVEETPKGWTYTPPTSSPLNTHPAWTRATVEPHRTLVVLTTEAPGFTTSETRGATFRTLAVACEAAERAYCNAYVGRALPKKPA